MKSMPRILPLVGIALGGVLAINALAGARDLPGMLSGARAWAEEAAAPTKPAKKAAAKTPAAAKAADPAAAPANPAAPAVPGGPVAATGDAKDAAAVALPPPTIRPKAVCAPTAAELAKEAGLSPAELQVLQNLGARRGQLDQREADLSTQLALLAAAEAKLDAMTKVLTALKADIQGLLAQADGREASEVDRLVKVFEGMKPQDAADRIAILDDSVRLPIAAKMKERSLSAIVCQMPPLDAKKLTESLSHRFAAAQTLAQNASTKADAVASKRTAVADDPTKAAPAKARPVRRAKKAPPRKKAPVDAGRRRQAGGQARRRSAPAAAPLPAQAG